MAGMTAWNHEESFMHYCQLSEKREMETLITSIPKLGLASLRI